MALTAYAVCTFSSKPLLDLVLPTAIYSLVPCTDISVMLFEVIFMSILFSAVLLLYSRIGSK